MKATIEFTAYSEAGETTCSEATIKFANGTLIRGTLETVVLENDVTVFENTTGLTEETAEQILLDTIWCNCNGELRTIDLDIEIPGP